MICFNYILFYNKMTEEEFRPIPGFEGYKVSNFGNVMGKKNTILKYSCSKGGGFYPSIALYKDKKWYSSRIHRLVALAFIPNPDNLPSVDHIDRNKSNNNVNNLRWADQKTQINNQKPFRDIKKNKTGQRYIHFDKRANKKQYYLQIHNKHINNGKLFYKYFYTIEEAVVFRDKLINDAIATIQRNI